MIQKEDDYVPGFEDIEGDKESENHNNFVGNQEQMGEEEAELSNSNSKSWKGQESPRNKESRQATPSITRTKTVSFSCVGDSEEVYKARRHIKHLTAQGANDEVNEGSFSISQPPPGFEFESQSPPLVVTDRTNNERSLRSEDLDNHHNERTKVKDYKRALLNEQHCSKHTQLGSENINKDNGQGLQQVQDPSNTTEETSESLKQLAHESLQVGEILGIKVIGDYEAALSRITKPLKKNRSKKRVMQNEDRGLEC